MSSDSLARRRVRGARVAKGALLRLGLAALLLLLLPAAASAYTLVLRSGRQVTIPDTFQVTPTAVVYEASPGFRVTVWLSNVDFAATDRANSEPAGSFAARVRQGAARGAAARTPQARRPGHVEGQRVVTNRELEPSRLRREAQEEEYERTRRERGMPSARELERRAQERDRSLHELARQLEAQRREAELQSLRVELMNVRRQLTELSLQLSQPAAPDYVLPSGYPYFYAPPVNVINVPRFGHRGRHVRGGFGRRPHGRPHPLDPRLGRSPTLNNVGPSRGASSMPRAMPRAGRAPR